MTYRSLSYLTTDCFASSSYPRVDVYSSTFWTVATTDGLTTLLEDFPPPNTIDFSPVVLGCCEVIIISDVVHLSLKDSYESCLSMDDLSLKSPSDTSLSILFDDILLLSDSSYSECFLNLGELPSRFSWKVSCASTTAREGTCTPPPLLVYLKNSEPVMTFGLISYLLLLKVSVITPSYTVDS